MAVGVPVEWFFASLGVREAVQSCILVLLPLISDGEGAVLRLPLAGTDWAECTERGGERKRRVHSAFDEVVGDQIYVSSSTVVTNNIWPSLCRILSDRNAA